MSIEQYARKYPLLLRMPNPRGHLELLETIGKGNYGYVYKAKMIKKHNELAAVKVVFLQEDEIEEALLEIEILEAMNHENITKLNGSYLKGLDLWISMEYCGAGSIDKIYKTYQDQIPEDALASILYETLLALEYIHTKVGLIHRDIKAGNLLLTIKGQLKLADFGVSARLKRVGDSAKTFIGTPYWMAPECDLDATNGGSYSDKFDLWSLGITAIEIIDKTPPFSDLHPMAAMNMIVKALPGFSNPKSVPKAILEFVSFLLIKNPSHRPNATEALMHPFMKFAKKLQRGKILVNLIQNVNIIKDKLKFGAFVGDDEQAVVSKFSKKDEVKRFSARSGFSTIDNVKVDIFDEFPEIVNNVLPGSKCIFEPILISVKIEGLLTGAIMDQRYILLGTELGLFYLDKERANVVIPIPIITGLRFKKIVVLKKYNVMMVISGKNDQMRQYRLSAIRKLILFLEGNSPSLIDQTNTSVSMARVQLGMMKVNDYDHLNRPANTEDNKLINSWANDYIKIVNTRDTKDFSVHINETTAYLCLIGQGFGRKGITLFRWATAPYEQFMKIKSFWVPEIPKFVSMTTNGLNHTELFVGYKSELNRLSITDSQVTELGLHKSMKAKLSLFGKHRWRSFLQIPIKKEGAVLDSRNRKLSMITGKSRKKSLDIVAETYFLGTYERLTKVVDRNASPMIGDGVGGWKDGVLWSEAPLCQILRPLEHVINVGKNMIEIVEWKSACLNQRLSIDSSCGFRVLSNIQGDTLIAVDKVKTGTVLYWMKETIEMQLNTESKRLKVPDPVPQMKALKINRRSESIIARQ